MRLAGTILLILSTLSAAFAYWGIYTPAGRRRFDEMAGIIPFGMGVAAVVLLIAGAVLMFLARR